MRTSDNHQAIPDRRSQLIKLKFDIEQNVGVVKSTLAEGG